MFRFRTSKGCKEAQEERPHRYYDKTLSERRAEIERINLKYPDRVPVIVEKNPRSTDTLERIDKYKYLVPRDLQWAQMALLIRTRLRLKPTEGLFIFINNMLPESGRTIGELYTMHKDEAGFLVCLYSAENTFGTGDQT